MLCFIWLDFKEYKDIPGICVCMWGGGGRQIILSTLLFSRRFSLTRLLQKLPRKQLTLTNNKTQYFSKLLKYINPSNIHEFVNLLANERKESGVNWRSILRSFYFLVYLSISFSDFFYSSCGYCKGN